MIAVSMVGTAFFCLKVMRFCLKIGISHFIFPLRNFAPLRTFAVQLKKAMPQRTTKKSLRTAEKKV